MLVDEKWIIEARDGFAVGGEIVELRDENNALINLQNLSATMRISGYGRNEEFSTTSGNFVFVPVVAPATYPTAWEFKMTAPQVAVLKPGKNEFEVLIADQAGVLVGSMFGAIEKRK